MTTRKKPTKPKANNATAKRESYRRARFIVEYPEDWNATKAAIRAGYAESSAYQRGHELLQREDVLKAIDEEKKARLERVRIDKDYVLLRLLAIDHMDMADIFNDDYSLKPISEWPVVWRQFVSGVDVSEHTTRIGDTEDELITRLKKIKWPDKVKNLELIGKHVSVAAWDKDVNHNHKFEQMTLQELLAETLKND